LRDCGNAACTLANIKLSKRPIRVVGTSIREKRSRRKAGVAEGVIQRVWFSRSGTGDARVVERYSALHKRDIADSYPFSALASCGLRVEPSLDLSQQSSAGFTGIAGGKLSVQFDHRETGARRPEGVLHGRGRGQFGA
jgi:hypothetical protein